MGIDNNDNKIEIKPGRKEKKEFKKNFLFDMYIISK